MKIYFIVFCFLMVFAGFIKTTSATPIQWKSSEGGNDHWYDKIDYVSWWDESEQDAINKDGYLVTFHSQAENDFVWNNFGSFKYWIGAYQTNKDVEPEGNWAWVTNETWSFSNWSSGEPNNSLGEEDHARFVGGGFWNDVLNSGVESRKGNGYIIEYDNNPIPEPTTMLLLGAGMIGLVGIGRKKLFKKD